tara:strand:+ start:537 stop:1157 length:621 start_codon:yes stop_codon:yes gene_type:complete
MGVISNGTTLLDAGAIDSGIPTGAMTLIKTLTASGSSTLSFVDGASSVVFDGTYKEYVFKFIDIHPSADDSNIQFQVSINGGTNYNVAVTSTCFLAQHGEDGNNGGLAYYAARDEAQGTGFHDFMTDLGNANDECGAGFLHLFNPSSTTFVKHFIAKNNIIYGGGDRDFNYNYGGYFNTTSAVNAIQFKPVSGTIDLGTIKMYGIK